MKLQEIEQEARGLSEVERSQLILRLINTLGPSSEWISDEEVARRDLEMNDGSAKAITHEDFVRSIQKERGR